jgi:glutamate racemase
MQGSHHIGVFDSGYGGLTVFKSIAEKLPQYDYIYLGDNGRAPYGNRSFETVYEYTLECVKWFFEQGCELVIVACNTASAKALRTIQQQDLAKLGANKRVLGVIRPSAEVIGNYTKTKHIGVLGTKGTVNSGSYLIEIEKFAPDVVVHQHACPMWVPIVEYGEYKSAGADFFVKKYLDELMVKNADIDTILLACTHYPLLMDKMKKHLPAHINIVAQGDIVADSLADYLQRHPEMESRITRGDNMQFFTTDSVEDFNEHATTFFGKKVSAQHLHLV